MAAVEQSPGTPRREGRGFISSFGAGRTCLAEDCETVLSRYNDKTHCWQHDLQRRTG